MIFFMKMSSSTTEDQLQTAVLIYQLDGNYIGGHSDECTQEMNPQKSVCGQPAIRDSSLCFISK